VTHLIEVLDVVDETALVEEAVVPRLQLVLGTGLARIDQALCWNRVRRVS
jgi:hypothetical protein